MTWPKLRYPIYGGCGWHSCSKHDLWRAFVDGLIDNDKKEPLLKKTCLIQETMPYFWPKWPKSRPYLWPKWPKNHTLWGRTYLYSQYKGVTPPPPRNCDIPSKGCNARDLKQAQYYILLFIHPVSPPSSNVDCLSGRRFHCRFSSILFVAPQSLLFPPGTYLLKNIIKYITISQKISACEQPLSNMVWLFLSWSGQPYL